MQQSLSCSFSIHVPSFVGKRCEAQTLLSKQLSHLLSLSKHFSEKRIHSPQGFVTDHKLTHNIAIAMLPYHIHTHHHQLIIFIFGGDWRRLLSISSINLLMHDPISISISISRHEKAKPRVLSSIYLANRSKINQFNVNVKK